MAVVNPLSKVVYETRSVVIQGAFKGGTSNYIPQYLWDDMMTASDGNIFRVTGPLFGNSPVTGEFPAERPVTQSFDVFYDLLNKRSSKQW